MTLSRRVLVAGAFAGLLLAGCDRLGSAAGAPSFHATDITGAEFARRLELPDVDGKMRTLADWKGKVTVVFFGYTQCPDVCPTTMAELSQIRKSLGAEGDRIETVFVTIDPERDTPEVLKAYVGNFGPGFTALRGSAEQTAAAAKEFKVFYAKAPGRTPGSYTMDHTAGSYIFDAAGKIRLFTRYGSGAESLKHDLQLLLATA